MSDGIDPSPQSETEAATIVSEAVAGRRTLGLSGGGSRAGLGRPTSAKVTLDSSRLTGIVFYEPSELVIGARAGTPVSEIAAALADNGQELAFEPMDHRAVYGTDGEPTIGGLAAVNASGPRRIKVGAARDALLGVRFVNGKGEIIKTGGRVMKNVTGLDLVKPLCGSLGTLGFMTELVFKVLPKSERSVTLVIPGLSDTDAVAALSAALGSPYEPAGAAHLPAGVGAAEARTLVRLEGFDHTVAHRVAALRETLGRFGEIGISEGGDAATLWSDICDVRLLAAPQEQAVWKISTIPERAPTIVAAIGASLDARWFYDWGGGLIWLAVPDEGDAGAATIRKAVAAATGHATLIRASDQTRRQVPVFAPLDAALATLSAGIKRSFDPYGVFEPGRMYDL